MRRRCLCGSSEKTCTVPRVGAINPASRRRRVDGWRRYRPDHGGGTDPELDRHFAQGSEVPVKLRGGIKPGGCSGRGVYSVRRLGDFSKHSASFPWPDLPAACRPYRKNKVLLFRARVHRFVPAHLAGSSIAVLSAGAPAGCAAGVLRAVRAHTSTRTLACNWVAWNGAPSRP